MKKYFVLLVISVFSMFCVLQIPNITNELAKECSAVRVVNSTASESVFCKGVIEEELGKFIVRAQISEEDVYKVGVNKSVKITCKALGDRILYGKVKELSDYAYKIVYGGVNVTVIDTVIEFDKEYDNLKLGYTVTAEIIYTELENAVVLPYEGIAQEKDGKYYVYRINEDWAVKEYVEVAFEDEKGAVISGKCDFNKVCEEPESFSGEFVRIKNVRND